MAKYDFRVPDSERNEFDSLVRRANRRILSNMKYIQQEEIESESTKRSLLGRQADVSTWNTSKTPFSRSVRFSPVNIGKGKQLTGEQSYKAYKRMLTRIADEGEHDPQALKDGYYKAIIRNLTTVALVNGEGILLKNGKLPANLSKKISEMSLEQMVHYFEEGDPADDMEYIPYSGEDYEDVTDRQQFVDITMKRLNTLKELYPTKEQRALRETYGRRYPGKQIYELEKIHNRTVNRKKKKTKRKRKKK